MYLVGLKTNVYNLSALVKWRQESQAFKLPRQLEASPDYKS